VRDARATQTQSFRLFPRGLSAGQVVPDAEPLPYRVHGSRHFRARFFRCGAESGQDFQQLGALAFRVGDGLRV